MKAKRFMALTAIALCSMATIFPISAEAKKISGVAAAKKLAKNKVKGAVVTEVDTDYDKGALVYDVELHKGKREYNLEYRASDGKLMKFEWELAYIGSSKTKKISASKIRAKAVKKVKNAKVIHVKFDSDLHKPEYDVTLKKGNKKYELSYNAYNAKLVEYGWEITQSTANSSSKYIGLSKAKSIAMKKVPGGQFTKAEFDMDDGIPVYEIEMVKDGMEYELKINAKTGKIMEYDVDIDD